MTDLSPTSLAGCLRLARQGRQSVVLTLIRDGEAIGHIELDQGSPVGAEALNARHGNDAIRFLLAQEDCELDAAAPRLLRAAGRRAR